MTSIRSDRPRVDVIMPSYNRPELTREAAESVRAQTFTDWRLFIVDDASAPAARERLRDVAASDERITLIERCTNGGPQIARHDGFLASDAPYIAFLDSDDLWLPRKLELQIDYFRKQPENCDLGVVLCRHQWVGLDGKPRRPVGGPSAKTDRGPQRPFNMSTLLVRRDVLVEVGGPRPETIRPLSTCEGVEFYLRLGATTRFGVVPEKLVECREHDGVRTSNGFRSVRGGEELTYVLALHEASLKDYPEERARLQGRAAARYLKSGRVREGLIRMVTTWKEAPPSMRAQLIRYYLPFTTRAVLRGAWQRWRGPGGAATS